MPITSVTRIVGARLAVAALWAALSPCLARGAMPPPMDSTRQVREVVVEARPLASEAMPAQRLGGERLRGLGSSSVADALRYFAGLQVKDYGGVGGLKTVNIRSMGSSHLGVCYDGVELGNAQNGQVDLGQLSLDNVEEITLYNGQRSALLQSASDHGRAGAVYIRTRRPTFAGKPYNLRARLRHATAGEAWAASATYERRLGSSACASVSAEGLTATGRYKFRYRRANVDGSTAYDTTATRRNGDMWAMRVEANLYGQAGHGAWTLKAYTYHSGRGIPGAIVNNVWRRGERQWDHNSFVQGSLTMALGSRLRTKLTAKYAHYDTHYVNSDTTTMLIDNRYRQQELYVSTASAYELTSRWGVAVSYDLRWNRLDADLRDFAYPRRLTHLLSLATAYGGERLRAQASVLATLVGDHTKRQASKPPERSVTPAVCVSWAPLGDKALWLRAFAKRSFRVPTFNELYYTDMGNATLRPETATQYDVGLVWERRWQRSPLSHLRLQADGYINSVSDKIIAYPRGQQFRWTMLNLGRVDIVGVDAMAEAAMRPARGLTVAARLQYTYQQAKDHTDQSSSYYGHQIPYTPWHSGSVALSVAHGGWSVNYSFIYTGERYAQQENTPTNRLQPWYTHDMNMAYSTKWGGAEVRFTLAVNNILGQDYDVIANYPMPKRNYVLAVEIRSF